MSNENPELPKYPESPENDVPNELPNNRRGRTALITGAITIVCGFLIAFSPLAMAYFSTAPGANMWSESDPNSGGSAIWLMIITLPAGFVVGIIGLIISIIGAVRSSRNKNKLVLEGK